MFAGDGGKSGISEYMRQVLTGMIEERPDMHFTLFMAEDDQSHFDPQHERVTVVVYPNLWGHPIFSIFWHLVWLPIALKIHGCDQVFMPAANRRLGWFYGVPSVGTVHDFSQLHIPAKYDRFRMFYIMKVLPKLMQKLDRVISISLSTQRDLESFAKVSSDKIDLVYNGATVSNIQGVDKHQAFIAVNEQFNLDGKPYLLYVSRIEHPGKNHIALLEAYKTLKDEDDIEHKLLFVGSKWSGSIAVEERIEELGLKDDVVITGFVSSEMLSNLYKGAFAFVFPSLFEGFGIPLLEAMAAGTPVCSSNRASMPEVVGDAGLLFEPDQPNQIVNCLRSLISDNSRYNALIDAGKARADEFTWQKCSRGVLDSCTKAAELPLLAGLKG